MTTPQAIALNLPRIIAHRCGGLWAPENTLAGLQVSAAAGVVGVEFDVMLSADAQPVLIHDETLMRTSNGRGRVAATDYARLAQLDAGSWFASRFAGEPIPSFAAAARLCRELGLWANVEIKPATGFDAATGKAVALAAQELWQDADQLPLLSSFSESALAAAQHQAPELPRGLLLNRIPRDWRSRLARLECVSLHCNWRGLSRGVVDEARAAGIPVLCYTVNDVDVARRLLDWGVSALISDWPDRLAGM